MLQPRETGQKYQKDGLGTHDAAAHRLGPQLRQPVLASTI